MLKFVKTGIWVDFRNIYNLAKYIFAENLATEKETAS